MPCDQRAKASQRLGKQRRRLRRAVYRDHAPRLRAFLRQIVGSFQAAEDLTQEIFTQLWTQPNHFDPTRGTLRAYLFGIGRHHAAEWWRRSKPQAVTRAQRRSSPGCADHSIFATVAFTQSRVESAGGRFVLSCSLDVCCASPRT